MLGLPLSEDQILHNRELLKGRCTIENSFGILSDRWQVLLKTIRVIPKNGDKIVLLHNFLLSNNRQQYAPNNYIDNYTDGVRTDDEWRQQVQGGNIASISQINRLGANNSTAESNIKYILLCIY